MIYLNFLQARLDIIDGKRGLFDYQELMSMLYADGWRESEVEKVEVEPGIIKVLIKDQFSGGYYRYIFTCSIQENHVKVEANKINRLLF